MTLQKFMKALGLTHPIIQAPMAGVVSVEMAAISTNNGILGSIPFAAVDITKSSEPIQAQFSLFQKATNGSRNVNFNFFSHDFQGQVAPSLAQLENWHKLYEKAGINDIKTKVAQLANSNISVKQAEEENPQRFEEFLQVLETSKPKMVSFHFGHPSQKTVERLQKNGILVFVTATSPKEAVHLVELGVDGLVCQGYEAGGHRGNFLTSQLLDENLSTFALFQQVKKIVESSPKDPYIIPAGGIVDGKTINYYLSLGASGVQLGTVFIPCKESNASDYIEKQILSGESPPTIMTELVSGKPARTLKTPFIERIVKANEGKNMPFYGFAYSGFKKLAGQLDQHHGFHLAGQNYLLIDPKLNTKQVIDKLKHEMNEYSKL